jgi:hypothetical protein
LRQTGGSEAQEASIRPPSTVERERRPEGFSRHHAPMRFVHCEGKDAIMPYGVDTIVTLETVFLDDGTKIAVMPEAMKSLNLTAGQKVDMDTAKKIIEENDRLTRAKN